MKIKLNWAHPNGSSLEVALTTPIWSRGRYTPEAHRLIRVLQMHGRSSGLLTNPDRISFGYSGVRGGVPEAINTAAKLQAELDKYANTPMRLKFGEPQMAALGGSMAGLVTTMREVRAARNKGATIEVSVLMSSNLPLTRQDAELFEAHKIIAYGPYSEGESTKRPPHWIGNINLCRYLYDDKEDPRVAVQNMIPIARRLVV